MTFRLSRRTKEGMFLAGLFLAGGLMLRASASAPGRLNTLDQVVLRSAAPVSMLVNGVVQGISDALRRYVFLVGVARENDTLRGEIARLKVELAQAERGALAAESLERLLELHKALGARSFGARVVSVDSSSYFRTARVHLGPNAERVKPGMAVLAATGVVGRIHRVYGSWADVLLAVDPAVAVDVLVGAAQARGVARGRPGRNRFRCALQFVDRNAELKAGDRVVASGMDGVFPRGALVGTVEKVWSKGGLFLEAEVVPAADFSELREVLVLPGLDP